MPFKAFNERYREHFSRQCKVSHYGFEKLVDLFEAMPSTLRVLYPPDGEWLIELTDSARAQWDNDHGDDDVNVGVVDVEDEDDDEDGGGAVSKGHTAGAMTAPPLAPFSRVPKPSPGFLRQDLTLSLKNVPVGNKIGDDKLASKEVGEEEDSNRDKTETQKRRFAAFKSLDFERLLSCR